MIWPSIRFVISLQIFKKPLDIFSTQIERKRFKEYLVIILAVKERFEQFSFLEFIFEKSKHREAGLKRQNQNIYLMGDFNIDLLKYETCSYTQTLLQTMQSFFNVPSGW